MLNKYLSLQQEALDACGQTVRQHQQLLQTEQQRVQQLEHYLNTMSTGQMQRNPLLRENSDGMQQQLQSLVKAQHALIADAEQALAQSRMSLRQQYARVKGLEQLHQQRENHRVQQEESRLRRTLDDLASYRFTTLSNR